MPAAMVGLLFIGSGQPLFHLRVSPNFVSPRRSAKTAAPRIGAKQPSSLRRPAFTQFVPAPQSCGVSISRSVPATAAIPAAAEQKEQDEHDDQKRGGVHGCISSMRDNARFRPGFPTPCQTFAATAKAGRRYWGKGDFAMPFFFMLPMIIFRGMWDVALDTGKVAMKPAQPE
jgi:hypothetical protein